VEMVFFGSAAPSRLEGPVRVGDIADRTQPWWSPLTEGEVQTVEFFVPEAHDPGRLQLWVAGASHVFTTPSSGFTKRLQDIGLAGTCNVDVPCSPLATQSAFRNAAESVAQMVFNDAGFTTICTGTLLADADASTQTPWFYGANHCFENDDPPFKTPAQMQAVANTLTTLWGFEATSCGSRTPRSGWSQLGGGATFIHNSVASDVLFLRLNAAPPAGAFYSGWDAAALGTGNALVALHHPQGDLKKASQGSVQRFASPGVGGGSASYAEVRWSSGTTEVGSSGSGIWSSNGSQYHFRGGLWGGNASCDLPSGTDYFSRFDQAYPALAPYLGSSSSTAVDYTDLWWNPNESGWGLNLTQHPSRAIFGVWYTYELDGSRTWYVMPGGNWTSSNTYSGALYTTAGPAFTAPFNPSQVETRQVGSATLTFHDANSGVFDYSIDGVAGSKSITRQPF
jgi:lysyl endopeptidase